MVCSGVMRCSFVVRFGVVWCGFLVWLFGIEV